MRPLSFVVLLLLAACGGDDDECAGPADASPWPDGGPLDPLCSGSACGGDVTGTWEVIASCARGTGDGSFFACDEGQVLFGDDFHVRGVWTIDASGAVHAEVSEHVSGRLELPLSCFGLQDCRAFTSVAEAAIDGIELSCTDLGPFDENCNVVPEACRCDTVIDDDEVVLDATLETDPEAGTITVTLGEMSMSGEYCVSDDELWVEVIRFGGVRYNYRFQRAVE